MRKAPKPIRIYPREYDITCPCGFAVKRWGIQKAIDALDAHRKICPKKL